MRLPQLVVPLILSAVVGLFDRLTTAAEHAVTIDVGGNGLTAVRVSITGKNKTAFGPEGARLRKTTDGRPYFYAAPRFKLDLPAGEFEMAVAAGMEFVPARRKLKVPQETAIRLRLERWSNLPGSGWYAGDSHVHLHTGGPLQVTTRDALLAAKAEGIHYVNLCVSNNVGDDIRDEKLITGQPHEDSSKDHLLVFGEEMRSMIYGHMQFFGIRKFVEPQYTGFKGTPHHHDYPANYTMAANATAQGGIVTYGHPMFKGQPSPFGDDLTADSAAARELPIDAMLGVVQAVDLMCYNSDEELSTRLWYRLLNCGLRLSASVGTDALLDRSTDPMGGSRVYVRVGNKLTQRAWLEGLKKGRTFVTNGPVPLLTINGKGPGATISLDAAGKVRVRGEVTSRVPVSRVELIANGKVVHTVSRAPKPADKTVRFKIDTRLPVTRSGWIALRAHGPDHPNVFDGPAFAHTSPIYVTIARQPIQSRDDAAYFVEWIDRLMRVVTVRNGYKTAEDRKKVLAIFRKAQTRYRKMSEGD